MRWTSGDGQPAIRKVATIVGIFMVAVVLWGGYSRRWPWTGINGSTATLWDWLNLLLLPLVVALAPIWARADRRLDERTKRAALAGLPVFSLIVLLGYVVPWGWTGFRGNTLWDWLGLTVLPVVVILIPTFAELQARWGPGHTRWAAIGLTVFGLIVLAGYAVPWAWTGFTGNTLWDWLHLLLVPLLIPIVLVPVLSAMVIVEVREREEEQAESPAIAGEPGEPGEPGQPGQPGEPREPVDPGEAGEPREPVDPGEPGEPVDPGEPGEPGSGSTLKAAGAHRRRATPSSARRT